MVLYKQCIGKKRDAGSEVGDRCVCAFMYLCVYACVYHIHTCMRICMRVYTIYIHLMRVYTIYIHVMFWHGYVLCMCESVRTHVHTHVCMYARDI